MTDNQPALGTVITDPAVRRIIYAAYVVATVIAGAITIAFATIGTLPMWVTVTNAVLGFLAIPVGSLALANTRATSGSDD